MELDGALTSEEIDEILAERLEYFLEGKRLVAASFCADCTSMGGDGYCARHDKNADYLEQES